MEYSQISPKQKEKVAQQLRARKHQANFIREQFNEVSTKAGIARQCGEWENYGKYKFQAGKLSMALEALEHKTTSTKG